MAHLEQSDDELDAWVVQTVQRALAYANSLVRNRAEAEDIVQDCYGRLLAKSAEYDLPRDGTKLLMKAISNACLNLVQRRPPVVSWEIAERSSAVDRKSLSAAGESGPQQQAMQAELQSAVDVALQELPVVQRAVVELRSLGHSLADVAEMVDVSEGNARVLLHRARQTLVIRLQPFLQENLP